MCLTDQVHRFTSIHWIRTLLGWKPDWGQKVPETNKKWKWRRLHRCPLMSQVLSILDINMHHGWCVHCDPIAQDTVHVNYLSMFSAKWVISHLSECVSTYVTSDDLWSDRTSPFHLQINTHVICSQPVWQTALSNRERVSALRCTARGCGG